MKSARTQPLLARHDALHAFVHALLSTRPISQWPPTPCSVQVKAFPESGPDAYRFILKKGQAICDSYVPNITSEMQPGVQLPAAAAPQRQLPPLCRCSRQR